MARLTDVPGLLLRRVDPEDLCRCWFNMCRIDLSAFTCDRDQFVAALAAEGCPAWVGYLSTPIYRHPLFRNENFFAGRWPVKELGLTTMDYKRVSLPVTEAICQSALHFTIREHHTEEFVDQCAAAVAKVAAFHRRKRP
jgi:perosamine synthetase